MLRIERDAALVVGGVVDARAAAIERAADPRMGERDLAFRDELFADRDAAVDMRAVGRDRRAAPVGGAIADLAFDHREACADPRMQQADRAAESEIGDVDAAADLGLIEEQHRLVHQPVAPIPAFADARQLGAEADGEAVADMRAQEPHAALRAEIEIEREHAVDRGAMRVDRIARMEAVAFAGDDGRAARPDRAFEMRVVEAQPAIGDNLAVQEEAALDMRIGETQRRSCDPTAARRPSHALAAP